MRRDKIERCVVNIVLLVIDTLRYDAVGAHGVNGTIRTPNLDRLAAASLVFDRAYSASYPTIPHRTDVMTGRHGGPFNPWAPLRFDLPTLPRLLADAGYCTQLIHDTPHLVNGGHAFDHPFHAWTFIRGAEVDRPWIDDAAFEPLPNWTQDPLFDFAGDPDLRALRDHTVVTYLRANRGRAEPDDWNAARLFEKAAGFLRHNARRRNFFLWVDCFDPHEPWDAPPDFVRMYDATPGNDGTIDPRSFLMAARNPGETPAPDGVAEKLRSCYFAKVSWMDDCVGRLMHALESTGLDEHTALVVTADHGTNLGERGRFGKGYPVHEQEGHVPLFVRVPGQTAGRSALTVQPHDIFATILGIAGAEPPDETGGHDLLDLVERGERGPRKVALSGRPSDEWENDPGTPMFTVFGDEWYLTVALEPAKCGLFRYGSTEDVVGDHPEVVSRLRADGIVELARRGVHAELIDWLAAEGAKPPPGKRPAGRCPRTGVFTGPRTTTAGDSARRRDGSTAERRRRTHSPAGRLGSAWEPVAAANCYGSCG